MMKETGENGRAPGAHFTRSSRSRPYQHNDVVTSSDRLREESVHVDTARHRHQQHSVAGNSSRRPTQQSSSLYVDRTKEPLLPHPSNRYQQQQNPQQNYYFGEGGGRVAANPSQHWALFEVDPLSGEDEIVTSQRIWASRYGKCQCIFGCIGLMALVVVILLLFYWMVKPAPNNDAHTTTIASTTTTTWTSTSPPSTTTTTSPPSTTTITSPTSTASSSTSTTTLTTSRTTRRTTPVTTTRTSSTSTTSTTPTPTEMSTLTTPSTDGWGPFTPPVTWPWPSPDATTDKVATTSPPIFPGPVPNELPTPPS